LRFRIWTIEKEYRNLLIWLNSQVDGSMDPVSWLVPIYLPWLDRNVLKFAIIAKLNAKSVAAQDYCNSIVWIPMPGHFLPWSKPHSTDQRCVLMNENIFSHSWIILLLSSVRRH